MPIGAVLFSSRAPIGYVAVAANEISTNQGFKSFICEDVVLPEFLFFYLKYAKPLVEELASGTTFAEISGKNAAQIPAPLPPLNEQRRIVAKLETLLSKVDACQQRLAKIPGILKRFRQAVLAAACSGRLTADWREGNQNVEISAPLIQKIQFHTSHFSGDLPELPDTWEWVALGNYGKCSRGRFSVRPRNDPSCYDGEHPFIQIGNLPPDGGWISTHQQTLNDKGLSVSKKFSYGTIAIAIVGATIGNTGLLSYEMCFPDSLVGIETGTLDGNKYVELYLRSRKVDLRQISYAGGGQPNIKLETLNPYPLALPPFPEQQEIVRRVEALFTLADQLEARYAKAKTHVDRLTQSILAKAFRGELVPQDENDEPASVLLERIRAQRAQAAPVKRKGVARREKAPSPQPLSPRARGAKAKPPRAEQPLPLVAETPAPYNRNIPQAILAQMQSGGEYSRAGITSATGITDAEWTWAIRQLKEEGKVVQTGERRGARYRLAR